MPSKEFTHEELKAIVAAKMADPNTTASDILSTILAALQEPTEVMLEAGYAWDEHVSSTETHPRNRGLWRAMLASSALGEQSE
ncbi:hypothetical protein [Brucella tritici]|uniref:hypothetical protein n=1 Tax=Brucella tritici TaxID=94626 RepID=UPI003D6D2F58